MKGWRTLVFNAVTLLLAGAGAVDPAMFGENAATVLLVLNGVGNIILRFLTTTPVGRK